jgi:hypothetical protein
MAASVAPVTVDADLALTIDGQECAVWSESDLLVVNVPTLTAARGLLSGVGTLPVPLRDLFSGLEATAMTVELRLQHAPVARFGADVDPSRLATIAGYDGALSLRGLAVGIYRQAL